MNAIGNFCKELSIKKRKKLNRLVMDKHPEKIPIILEYEETFPHELRTKQCKYLVNNTFRVFEFTSILRTKISIGKSQGLLMYINGEKKILIEQSKMLSSVYNDNASHDGFLYISLGIENIYG